MAADDHGYTPLHYACRDGKLELAKKLVYTDRLNPHLQANDGNTPLHLACLNGQIDVIVWLVEHCDADFDTILNKDGETARDLAKWTEAKWLYGLSQERKKKKKMSN